MAFEIRNNSNAVLAEIRDDGDISSEGVIDANHDGQTAELNGISAVGYFVDSNGNEASCAWGVGGLYIAESGGVYNVSLAEGDLNTWAGWFSDGTKEVQLVNATNTIDVINGHTNLLSMQCDSITNDTGLAAGTYTPTRSAEANLDANVTMSEAQYMRVGNTVTVSGRFTADPTLTATATSFEITLPVASNIGAVEDASGVAFCGTIAGMGAAILGSVANNTAVFQWVSTDITSQSWSYTFSYQVI